MFWTRKLFGLTGPAMRDVQDVLYRNAARCGRLDGTVEFKSYHMDRQKVLEFLDEVIKWRSVSEYLDNHRESLHKLTSYTPVTRHELQELAELVDKFILTQFIQPKDGAIKASKDAGMTHVTKAEAQALSASIRGLAERTQRKRAVPLESVATGIDADRAFIVLRTMIDLAACRPYGIRTVDARATLAGLRHNVPVDGNDLSALLEAVDAAVQKCQML